MYTWKNFKLDLAKSSLVQYGAKPFLVLQRFLVKPKAREGWHEPERRGKTFGLSHDWHHICFPKWTLMWEWKCDECLMKKWTMVAETLLQLNEITFLKGNPVVKCDKELTKTDLLLCDCWWDLNYGSLHYFKGQKYSFKYFPKCVCVYFVGIQLCACFKQYHNILPKTVLTVFCVTWISFCACCIPVCVASWLIKLAMYFFQMICHIAKKKKELAAEGGLFFTSIHQPPGRL